MKFFRNVSLSLLAAAALYSTPAAFADDSAATSASRTEAKGLSRTEAERRAALVSDLHYQLLFHLDAKAVDFTGEVTATFNAAKAGEELSMDFDGGRIERLAINDQAVKDVRYNGRFVVLPGSMIKKDANQIAIVFSHPYSTTGKGLYRFKDPEDGKTYAYTDFEPFDANRLFPCFDQPDLKATYTLTVDAPARWTVISSTRETKVTPAKGGLKHWVFPETKRFSTYLFSMHAGEYKEWDGKAGNIPLRLFARQSMAKYIDATEWLKITSQGLGFYQSYFDFPYPFDKFDQIIVPDFNAGAMENVAAITFSENYFPRGKSTRNDRLNRAGVILHEMAHQWFGDLVTMTWWNDLWLNESFATYMSSLAASEATEFKEAWLDFFGEKAWAYQEDQLVTTHPIEGVVPDTEQAFASFDGITYGKGASVLKQLNLFLGPDKFRDGVRAYFKKHQFGNARLSDFIGALGQAAGQDLASWSDEWLRTSGVNGIVADYACDGGKITTFALTQRASADEAHSLRAHSTKIGLYKEDEHGAVVLSKAVTTNYKGASTPVPELVGEACPIMAFPNHEDFDYAKVALDPRSLTVAKTKLSHVSDPHLRRMIWHSLWEMVRDGDLPVTEYADTVLSQSPSEKEIQVLSPILTSVYGRRRGNASIIGYLPIEGESAALRAEFLHTATQRFLAQAKAAAPGSDMQKLYFDAYVRMGEFPEAGVKLADVLSGKLSFKGLPLDQDRRWNVLYQLSATGTSGAEALRKAELKRDSSARGQLANLEAEASEPTPLVKDHWYKEITDPKTKRSFAQLKAAMRGLLPSSEWQFRAQLGPRYYADLAASVKTRDNDFLGAFTGSLVPAICTPSSVHDLASYIAAHQDYPPVVLKSLRISHQEDERCVKIRQTASTPQKS